MSPFLYPLFGIYLEYAQTKDCEMFKKIQYRITIADSYFL